MSQKYAIGPMGKIMDHYAVLGVSRFATSQEIQSAYRKRCLKCHPDKFPNDPTKEEEFKRLGAIRSVLEDDAQRERYDKALGRESEQTTPRATENQKNLGVSYGQRQHKRSSGKDSLAGPAHNRHHTGAHKEATREARVHTNKSYTKDNRAQYRSRYEAEDLTEQKDDFSDEGSCKDKGSRTHRNAQNAGRSRYNDPPTPSAEYAPGALFGGYRRPAPSYELEPFWSMRHQERRTREYFHDIIDRCTSICKMASWTEDLLKGLERVARKEYQLSKHRQHDLSVDPMVSKLCIMVDMLFLVLEHSSIDYRRLLNCLDEAVRIMGDCMPILRDIDDLARDLKKSWSVTEDALYYMDEKVERGGMKVGDMVSEMERLLVLWDKTHDLPGSMRDTIYRVRKHSRFLYTSRRYNCEYYLDLAC